MPSSVPSLLPQPSLPSPTHVTELFRNASLATAPPNGIVLLGEALGAEEEKVGLPFQGPAGKLLNGLLARTGIARERCSILNVFNIRPANNDLTTLCVNKTEAGKDYPLPALARGAYLAPQHLWHLDRLKAELAQLNPRLIIGLGSTALWALTGLDKITKNRGVILPLPSGPHALFTIHPAAVLRQHDQYPIVAADLRKAWRWINGDLPAPMTRTLVINPTEAEIEENYQLFISQPHRQLGVDIETSPITNQITTIAFGWPEHAICLPVWNKETLADQCNVVASVEDELRRWEWIEKYAHLPNPKVQQNGLYDMSYLLFAGPIEIRLCNVTDDTAVMHHAMQPELRKDLATLASLYLNEKLWKFLRLGAKDSGEQKADE